MTLDQVQNLLGSKVALGPWADISLSKRTLWAFNLHAVQVPATYIEMFEFNATVMGFGKHRWLREAWTWRCA